MKKTYNHVPSWYENNEGGISPHALSRKQLLRVLSMRASAGRKLRRPLESFKNSSKKTIINEVRRVKGNYSWADLYFNPQIQRLFGK